MVNHRGEDSDPANDFVPTYLGTYYYYYTEYMRYGSALSILCSLSPPPSVALITPSSFLSPKGNWASRVAQTLESVSVSLTKMLDRDHFLSSVLSILAATSAETSERATTYYYRNEEEANKF